ncbi:hypothetical protein D7027_21395 [Ochrobactrum intermedium]|uniref:antitoxin VbhA family protein n=1 Tax=Brucella intermedia TaxID=94625 RepID=UPI0012CFC8DB|nr:hypothetical protein [Brucella intermedia]
MTITPEETERHRKNVRRVIRSNALEGATHGPEVEPILEAYISGEIEAHDIIRKIKEIRGY